MRRQRARAGRASRARRRPGGWLGRRDRRAHVDGHPVWGSCVARRRLPATHGDEARPRCATASTSSCSRGARRRAATRTTRGVQTRDPDRDGRPRDRARVRDQHQPADLEPTYDKLRREARAADAAPRRVSRLGLRARHARPPTRARRGRGRARRRDHEDRRARWRGETGLFGVDAVAIAQPIADAASVKLDHENVSPTLPIGLDAHYAAALFAIPEVGRTSARSVRSTAGT